MEGMAAAIPIYLSKQALICDALAFYDNEVERGQVMRRQITFSCNLGLGAGSSTAIRLPASHPPSLPACLHTNTSLRARTSGRRAEGLKTVPLLPPSSHPLLAQKPRIIEDGDQGAAHEALDFFMRAIRVPKE
jgi:hypothetical protein